MDLLLNSLPLRGEMLLVSAAFHGVGPWRRKLAAAGVGVASGLLMVALSVGAFAPLAFGQGQAGAATQGQNSSAANSAAKPPAGAAAQTSAASASDPAQKSGAASTQNEPQMQDQSAPAAE